MEVTAIIEPLYGEVFHTVTRDTGYLRFQRECGSGFYLAAGDYAQCYNFYGVYGSPVETLLGTPIRRAFFLRTDQKVYYRLETALGVVTFEFGDRDDLVGGFTVLRTYPDGDIVWRSS